MLANPLLNRRLKVPLGKALRPHLYLWSTSQRGMARKTPRPWPLIDHVSVGNIARTRRLNAKDVGAGFGRVSTARDAA